MQNLQLAVAEANMFAIPGLELLLQQSFRKPIGFFVLTT